MAWPASWCDTTQLTVICPAGSGDPLRNELLDLCQHEHETVSVHVSAIVSHEDACGVIRILAFLLRQLKFVVFRATQHQHARSGHQEARVVIRAISQNRWRGICLFCLSPPIHLREECAVVKHDDDMCPALLSAR